MPDSAAVPPGRVEGSVAVSPFAPLSAMYVVDDSLRMKFIDWRAIGRLIARSEYAADFVMAAMLL